MFIALDELKQEFIKGDTLEKIYYEMNMEGLDVGNYDFYELGKFFEVYLKSTQTYQILRKEK